MEPPAPFRRLGQHFAIELPGARAVFTTRRGGHSTGAYASLNLGLGTDDDPGAVARNRADVERALGVTLTRCRQVHGTTIHRAERPAGSEAPEADGQLTTVPGLAPLVLVADCLPIVIAAPGAVIVLHAGWRGLAGGIVQKGADALRQAAGGGPAAAAIGPGVAGCCYEVGDEVHAAFARYGPSVRDGAKLDLKAVARSALAEAGVADVHDLGLCTMCDRVRFYSHRRENGLTGRQAGIAWLS